MTLRLIVGRILGELIEQAERDADASWSTRCTTRSMSRRRHRRTEGVSEPRGFSPEPRRLGTFRRTERQVGVGRDRDCPR